MILIVDFKSIIFDIFNLVDRGRVGMIFKFISRLEDDFIDRYDTIIFLLDNTIENNGESDLRRRVDPEYCYNQRLGRVNRDIYEEFLKLLKYFIINRSEKYRLITRSKIPSTDLLGALLKCYPSSHIISNSKLAEKFLYTSQNHNILSYSFRDSSWNNKSVSGHFKSYDEWVMFHSIVGISDMRIFSAIDNYIEEGKLYKYLSSMSSEEDLSMIKEYDANVSRYRMNRDLITLYDKVINEGKIQTSIMRNMIQGTYKPYIVNLYREALSNVGLTLFDSSEEYTSNVRPKIFMGMRF